MMGKKLVPPGPKLKYSLILLLIFGLALFLRIYPRLGDVFGGGWVRFGEVDPWYHIRLLENLLQHYPSQIAFDPYTYYPYGQTVVFAPFFDLMVGTVAWIIGLGSPSLHTVEVTAAYFPAVLGALTIIPVYFIGKELFNQKAGLMAAALVAILPGNFLARSLLGVTDHHGAETLFSTVTALFLILAIKNARDKIDFNDIRNKAWSKLRKPLIYSLLCGLFLGMYVATWIGALLFVLIIFIYVLIQFMVDHWMGKSTDYLCIIGLPAFCVALLMVLPFLGKGGLSAMHPVSLAFAISVSVLLGGLSRFSEKKHFKRFYFPLAILGTIAVTAGVVYAVAPGLFVKMLGRFEIFLPHGGSMTISEAQPLFFGFDLSHLSQSRVWGFFTTGFFIIPITFVLLGLSVFKNFKAERLFFLIWSVLMLAAMLGQNRFSYYFAVNAAILGGYFGWKMFGWIDWILKKLGLKDAEPNNQQMAIKRKGQAAAKRKESLVARYLKPRVVSAALAALAVFFLIYYPNISPAIDVVKLDTGPNQDWHDSLLWMKENTPDPFQNPDFFNQKYTAPASGENYDYPKSAYGVMSAWDYGHWITTIAHRIPNSNPHQSGASVTARFFTAQDESRAARILDKLDSKYVVMDYDMVTIIFNNYVGWTGESQTRYFDTYYRANEQGKFEPVNVFYPEYYESMSSRLYNFGGEKVVPQNSSWVITYEERTDTKGIKYKRLINSKLFPTYEEAKVFIQKTPNSRIVGTDPFSSPVPLEKLQHFTLVHSSNTIAKQNGDRKISDVEIFEYQP